MSNAGKAQNAPNSKRALKIFKILKSAHCIEYTLNARRAQRKKKVFQ